MFASDPIGRRRELLLGGRAPERTRDCAVSGVAVQRSHALGENSSGIACGWLAGARNLSTHAG
jgi:hypothetical protein